MDQVRLGHINISKIQSKPNNQKNNNQTEIKPANTHLPWPSSNLLKVYFGSSSNPTPETQLKEILAQKIAEHGKITSDMIDKKTARLLFLVAKSIYKNAYAPYSKFKVGAAVITEKGNIFKGVNIENVTYNSNLHGETTAISNMVINEGPDARIVACAVSSQKMNPITPCGGCRQTIAEFSSTWDTKLISAKNLNPTEDEIDIDKLGDMLPKGFSPSVLRKDNIQGL